MKKVITILLVCTLVLSLFSGCTMGGPADQIMKPPSLTIDQEEVKNILKDVLEPDAELKMPVDGGNTSAIQFVDLDGDKEDEVLVFYILPNDETPLRTLILDKDKDKEWKIIDGMKGIGNDFDRVEFKDITGDGNLEVLIGYRGEGFFENKGLSIYDYENGETKEIFNNSYSAMASGDIDEDGTDELVLIKSDREEGFAKAELYKYAQTSIEKVNETDMEAFAVYNKVVIGKATEDKMGIFVSEVIGAHSGLTELLIMENGQIKNVFFNKVRETTNETFSAYPTQPQDIDNDGIIEIATLRSPIAYEDASMAGTPWIHRWYNWDGKKGLVYNSESYFDYSSGFYFNFPEKWGKNITIDRSEATGDEKENWITFSYLEKIDSERHPLLTIETININEWEEKQKEFENKNLNYFELGRSTDRIYVVILGETPEEDSAAKMMLSVEEIKANFNLIE